MEINPTQKKGFIILIIGIIMIVMIIFAKIKGNFVSKENNTNISNVQLENVVIDENADYTRAIKTYITAIQQKDSAKFSSVFPSFIEADTESITKQLDSLHTQYESSCGTNIKITYNIKEVKKLDSDSVKTIENNIKQNYQTFTGSVDTIYRAELHVKITGDTKSEEDDEYILVGKIGNSWYIF
mgnify:FL=1